jgi:hypothetical protein
VSRWTHAICANCWNEKHPDREPVRLKEEFLDETAVPCCFCGKPQQSGIFMRADPFGLACKGEGVVHAE